MGYEVRCGWRLKVEQIPHFQDEFVRFQFHPNPLPCRQYKFRVGCVKKTVPQAQIKFGFEAEQLKGIAETLKGIELNGQKSIETISNTLVSNNISSTNNSKEMVEKISEVVLVNTEQLKQDSKQFKADNRTSAAEEAAGAGSKTGIGGVLTGGNSDKNKSVVEDGVGGIMSTISDVLSEGAGGVLAYKQLMRVWVIVCP